MQAMTGQAADIVTPALNAVLAFIMLLAAALALPVSFALIWLYRRAVTKSMRTRARPAAPESAPLSTSTPHPPPAQAAPGVTVVDATSSIPAGAEAKGLHAETLHAPWRAAAVYVVAGVCHALIMAAANHAASAERGFRPLSMLFLLLVFAWPAVITVNLVAATTVRARLAAAAVYFLIFAAVSAVAVSLSAELSWRLVIGLWLAANLPATLLLLTFLNRRVRAVGPLVLIFMLVAVIGMQTALSALSLAGSDEGVLRSIVEAGSFVGLGAHGIFFGLAAAGFLLPWPVGWLALRWIRGRYERKKVSDQSITIDAVWLLFGVVTSIVLASAGALWVLPGLVAFLGYKVVARAGFWLFGRRDAARKSTGLLLLRVFSLGKRSERLFGALAKHWRHVGSIQLIAGHDLATETVEPHEFLDFLSGKLAGRFIDGADKLDRRVAEMDAEPDRDGRYRVNDFFCRDDTWKMVLSRLVSESDVVLMDLRGFSSQNAGCVFEINELINVVPLERVKFIVDATTDEQFLLRSVRQSWGLMRPASPNRPPAHGQLRLFRFTGARRGELRQLLLALCAAAKAT
jgi:hypothetical protein